MQRLNSIKRWSITVALSALTLGTLAPALAFAASQPVVKKVVEPPAIVVTVVHSAEFASYLHTSKKVVTADLRHHESLLTLATAHKIDQAHLIGELSTLIHDTLLVDVKDHRLTSSKEAAMQKQADASLAAAVNNRDLRVTRHLLAGRLLREVSSLLHMKGKLIVKDRLHGHSIVALAASKHITEATLVKDLVAYRLKTSKHKLSESVIDKEIVAMVTKK